MKNDELHSALANAQNAVFLCFKNALKPFDITPVQHAVLQCLWQADAQTPSALAEQLHLDTSTITGILSRMEAKALLRRTFCESDRRRVLVHLLPDGAELQEKLGNTIENLNRMLLADFTAEETQTLKKCLLILEEKAKNV